MALEKTHNFRGVVVQNAYHRIVRIELNRGRLDTHITIEVFADASQPEPIDTVTCRVPYATETGNVVEWAYNEVKKVPDFANAVDA